MVMSLCIKSSSILEEFTRADGKEVSGLDQVV